MTNDDLLTLFRETGALLDGHFQLTSGLHSSQYFQCARVLQHPAHTERLCGALAAQVRPLRPDCVIAPALGGIVVGQEVGRQLGVRTMFTERKDRSMELRRGFTITPGERVVVCEDVVTTGGSVVEVLNIVRERGGVPVAAAYIVDRSGGTVDFGVSSVSLLRLHVVTWQPADCPLCRTGSPAVKPGSRPGA
jgi:orotate phosphoribosyltransferase